MEWFWGLLQSHPDSKAVWYDGQSDIINGIFDFLNPKEILIEEGINTTLIEKQKPINSTSIIIQSNKEVVEYTKPICVFVSNDTHAHLFKRIPQVIPVSNFITISSKNENADIALSNLGIGFSQMQLSTIQPSQYQSLLLSNDWGGIEILLQDKFHKKGIPTICLQESVIDFNDQYHRMEICDYPLLQGVATLKHLERNVYFLTGNPRYEELQIQPLPSSDFVMINCNFTYGIFEEWREQWISDIVSSCTNLNLEYVISQHPRDRGDLSGYNVQKSSAAIVHKMICAASTVITRFSSIIHESLAMGRTVIYYNPHGEKMNYDFEPDGEHLIVARNKAELIEALSKTRIVNRMRGQDPFFYQYMMRHCGSADSSASSRIGNSLKLIHKINPIRHRVDFILKLRLSFHLFRKKLLASFKYRRV